jgi:AraC family transcriptional regulator
MLYIKQLEDAILYIENNLENKISVMEVAKVSNYSYFHFHRLFEAILGQTVGNYIRSRRLTKAASHLIYTNKKIIDIAISLQFESQEAFTRAFKKYYKVTPNEYRKNRIDTIIGNRHSLSITDLNHLSKNITIEPEIVEVQDMKLIGMRFPTSISNNKTVQVWSEFNSRIHEIKNILQDSNRYGFFEANGTPCSDSFNKDYMTNEFIGVNVTDFNNNPQDMHFKHFIGGKYAKFVNKGCVDTIYKTYYYIWGTWIPTCKYELDNRDDFECYTQNFLGIDNEHSEIEIYVPIK